MEMQIASSHRSKEREDKRKLRAETFQWQKAAIGLFTVSLVVNMAQQARIAVLEDQLRADEALRQSEAALWEAKLERMEHTRDMAVQALGDAVLQAEADKQARAEQAAAYEMVGAYRYVGECTVTAYCPCEECCGRWADGLTATGLPAGPGIVAVDQEVIPLGSTVIIDGQKYLAADTGVTGLAVDICMEDHASTVEAGVRSAEVWVVCEE